ncbi:hypothetical protein [Fervidibacillus albus]|uniref:Uncharacterized protein n=1 Tax=Fervidibacillus albus TaxID=2980026 RepID=A0A9E8LS86_9BACI|nr:hypothetical protein [Fervidibacillus albus]WAA08638.1 hypothetical protein OE104_08255 [Fervidibacillus albus]
MEKTTNKHSSKPLLYIQQPDFPEISVPQQEKIFMHIDRTVDGSKMEGKGKRKKQKKIHVGDDTSHEGKAERFSEKDEKYGNSPSMSEGNRIDETDEKNGLLTENVTGERSGFPVASDSEKERVQQGEAKEKIGNRYKRIPIEDIEGDEQDGKVGNTKEMIRRLALYPSVLQRPFCEATVQGEKKRFQVLSKRGNLVRIKTGKSIETYHIGEFEDFQILYSNKNEQSENPL